VVVSDIPPVIVFALTPLWPTAGFLLHFKEGIHVIGKESSRQQHKEKSWIENISQTDAE
jgi:hypothetical protein